MGKEEAGERKLPNLKVILTWSIAAGFVCWAVAPFLGPLHELAVHFGHALIISAVIGGGLEYYLHKQFARSMLQAAFGENLPPGLLDEIHSLYSQKIICEKCRVIAHLEEISPSLVRLEIEWIAEFKNISNATVEYPVKLAIDEWNHVGQPSKILSSTYELRGQSETLTELEAPNGAVLRIRTKPVALAPKERIRTVHRYRETKHRNDEHRIAVTYPTVRPLIVNRKSSKLPNVVFKSGFSTHTKAGVQVTEETCELPTLLLPYQQIIIRWYEFDGLSPAAAAPSQ